MKSPSIMDIKLGVGLNKLKNSTKIRGGTTDLLKFRICGMIVYQGKTNEPLFKDKYWGRKIKPEEIKESLSLFFNNGIHLIKYRGETLFKNN